MPLFILITVVFSSLRWKLSHDMAIAWFQDVSCSQVTDSETTNPYDTRNLYPFTQPIPLTHTHHPRIVWDMSGFAALIDVESPVELKGEQVDCLEDFNNTVLYDLIKKSFLVTPYRILSLNV